MKPLTIQRWLLTNGLLLALLAVTLAVCACVGVPIDLRDALANWGKPNPSFDILFRTRIPRVLLAAVVGAALAPAGVVFQALLRNPLADPYILGVSAGGSLGAVTAIALGLDMTFLGISPVSLYTFAGALLAIALVYAIARPRGAVGVNTLLLAGIIVSYFLSAITMAITYVSDPYQSQKILRWLMGGLYLVSFQDLARSLPWVVAGFVAMFALARNLNLLTFGEESALQLGVDVERTKKVTFVVASLVTAAAVSVSGPIGFVGLIVPHAMRLIVGPDHRILLPASFLAGGLFLTVADTLARRLVAPTEIPVGVITALCGGPFFIWLLYRRQKRAFVS
ncbi:MAG: iron ABC transporter permease [Planctomycetes bacterium]|nr:iron ABC transporter permease [Planctomycetota bacterium]